MGASGRCTAHIVPHAPCEKPPCKAVRGRSGVGAHTTLSFCGHTTLWEGAPRSNGRGVSGRKSAR
eukprot:3290242-Prymnesium_polylepis.1